MFPEAIHEYKEILRLDPEQYQVLLTLGDQYMRMGEMDSALLYYEKYSMQLPQESQAYTKLGYYHRMNGDMERAQEYYENALAVADASEKASVMNYLASILRLTGKFDMAMEQYQEMLAGARTSRDSARVLDGKEKLFATKGQVKKALEIFEEKASLYKKILPPKDFMVYRVFNIEPYVMANELERAFDILEGIAEKLEPPLDNLVPFGYMMIYTETGETEKAMAAATNAEELIQDFGEEMLMANIYYTNGRVNEALGEYDQAINDYLKTLEINATSFELHVDIARCWRNLKENKKAKEEIQVALKYNPYDPLSHYEAALINLETGDKAVGMEHLEKAVEIWKDADEDYDKANLAKEKLESLNSGF
jgi:tetratricopeptide (TPR) repeat protein